MSRAPDALQVGVVFPQTEIGTDPGGIRDYGQAVSELGYRHVRAYDHVLGADRAGYPDWPWDGPYDHRSTFHEVFVLFGFLAAAAPELELASGVIILPQRQTALVAKQAAEIDVLTRGKFRLGVGVGYNPVEYEALGMEFGNRGKRFEEQIALLRRLFTEASLSFEGSWHTITSAGINPAPVQQPIPIWIGGTTERAMRRAARLGDGFLPIVKLEGMDWAETIGHLREWVTEAGRDASTFGIDPHVDAATGGPDDWHARIEEWRELGATHVSLVTMEAGLQGPDEHIARLAAVADVLA